VKKALQDKKFLKTIFTLALPIIIQSFITTSLNLIDNVMVGRLGETAIASVGLANQYIFIFSLCIFGINSGVGIFMSQFWGKKNLNKIKAFLGIDLTIGFIASSFFAILAGIFPQLIMRIFSNDIEVINSGASYLRIVAISCLFVNFTQGYSSALRSTGQVKLPMYGSLLGVLSNAFLNWIFIFGKFGVPELGANGAAVATTIARFIEMMFIFLSVYLRKNIVSAKIKEMTNFNIETVKTYFTTSWSVILNELIWSIGLSTYAVAYSKIGTQAVATMQIANTLNNMFLVFLSGMANAASIIIGNNIGAGDEERALDYSNKIAQLSILSGLILGIVVWITAPMVIKPFCVTEETAQSVINVLRIMAVFFTLRSYNMVMIVGVFRGGGDTTYAMALQGCTIWFYSVPLSFIGATIFKFSVEVVFMLIASEDIIKAIFQSRRLKTGKWLKNVVEAI